MPVSMGYMGTLLFVDLTAGTIKEEKPKEKFYRDFIGGPGLGVRILYEQMKGKVDPLGPDNMIGFVTGLLTGTVAPSSSRFTVVGKSPLTETWNDSNSGGYFASELKSTGYDAVFFRGVSPKPVYLLLQDGKAELRDATHLWGKDTVETEESLRLELGDKGVRIACIGPSGESQSLIAAVITEKGRAAGRSGLGAVMGAKKLKAIAVRGNKKVPVANVDRLRDLQRICLKNLQETKHLLIKPGNVGTANVISTQIPVGGAPIKNWSLSGADAWPSYTNLSWTEDKMAKYQVKKFTCSGCPIACGGIVSIENSPYAMEVGHRQEYEAVAGFGSMCLNDNLESVIKAQDICNFYGMDTISASSTIAFAMECYERGFIGREETEGIELVWGNPQAIIAMLNKMARRQGFGAVLADGVKRAAERIGKGAVEFAIHIHGQEPGYHDPRLYLARGLNYIIDPAPGRHTTSVAAVVAESGGSLGPYPELKFQQLEFNDYQHKVQMIATANNYQQNFVSSGLCLFELFSGNYPLIELISAVIGWDYTLSEALATGKRIQSLRQAFNAREGLRPENFKLPTRISSPPSTGPLAGREIDFDIARAAYYGEMGWDIESGRPSAELLKEIGLNG